MLGKGYLGKEFERHGLRVFGRDEFEVPAGLPPSNVDSYLEVRLRHFDVIVNCIGKSNTRWCEDTVNFDEALGINGSFPGMLSRYCTTTRKRLVHISTGCLYDRADIPNGEADFMVAHCRYTLTKWIGEVRCDPERDLILRPRLYFSDVPDRNNFLCKLPRFKHYVTCHNSYTCTTEIVRTVKALLKHDQSGIFNVACDGILTVCQIAELIGLKPRPISAEELRAIERCYLVNNTMNLAKLKRFYKPRQLEETVISCWRGLQGTEAHTARA